MTPEARSCPPNNPAHWRRCTAHVEARPFGYGPGPCGYPLRWDLTACTAPGRHPVTAPKPWLYATITGTRRNLAELAATGFRLLTTPDHLSRGEPPWAFGLDNGAWSGFDEVAFGVAVERHGSMADWIVLPDVVEGGHESLELSASWLPRLHGVGRLLLPVQDGLEAADVAPLLGPDVGVFVGGSTEWKEQTMAPWASLARSKGAWCHVGRVNTQRRLAMVVEAGADSCDGTSATRFAVNAAPLAEARRQGPLFGGMDVDLLAGEATP